MLNSMTGFADGTGSAPGWSWSWEIRAVNGRGLDLRVRAPDWIAGLEAGLRAETQKAVARGNVTVNLRLARDESADAATLDPEALARAIAMIRQVEAAANASGQPLAPVRATDILSMRGVQDAPVRDEVDQAWLRTLLVEDFAALLPRFNAMRGAEGRALGQVLAHQLETVESLVAQAASQAAARADGAGDRLRAGLDRILATTDAVSPERLAQELALLAMKSDVTEEIDRLRGHVGAARALLAQQGPVGRKLDFLIQEFNREANTLCSKAQDPALTQTGLDLKATIDQMREQVQNVE